MLRVRDIMTRQVYALASDATVDQAIWSFSAKQISGAPVRDPTGRLIGVVSKTDLLDPVHRGELEPDTPIAEAMTPALWAIHPDVPVMKAVQLMVARKIHRVLVASGPGKLEGIVTSLDVLRALARGHDLGPVMPEGASGAPQASQPDAPGKR